MKRWLCAIAFTLCWSVSIGSFAASHTLGDLRKARPKLEGVACLTIEDGMLLYTFDRYYNTTRVFSMGYDTDADSVADVILLFEFVRGSDLRPYPSAYIIVRRDIPKEYLDVKGNGRCADIIEIPPGSAFTGKRL